jgi:methyl-accepting chemotaxis protein
LPTIVATSLANDVDSSIEQLKRQLGDASPALVMVFASPKHPLSEVSQKLTDAFGSARVLGASTAGEFNETGDQKEAISAVAVAGDFVVHAGMATGLKASAEAAVSQATAEIPPSVDGFEHRTAIVLLDPLAGNGEEAVLMTSATLGEGVRLAGGAAGDDLKMTETHVSLGKQAASDAIVCAVISSKKPLGIGVAHGHAPLSDGVRITKAEGNVVYEVDGRPAWDVWAEHTREAAKAAGIDPDTIRDEDIGGFLLRYEAGLAAGETYKIRAPLSRGEDGSLSFACGIPEGATVRITESEPERQIESARQAARNALAQVGGDKPAGAVVFDCICRNLILGDTFKDAVVGISEELGGVPLAGFETYGEIALGGGDLSGFHNTTTVLLTFPT